MNSEWPDVMLKEVTSILGDGLHGTPVYDDSGDYFFINGSNLDDGRIVISNSTKRVAFSEYEKYKKNLNDRTILVSINGTLGNIGLYQGEKVVLGKSACYFNVLESVDKNFIRYVLASSLFQGYISNLATGSTIKNVSLRLMREFSFKLPPLGIQSKISLILKSLDDRITLLRETNATLEAIAQALFKSWFVDFDPVRAKAKGLEPEGMEAATAALFPASFEESRLGLIPKGWKCSTIGQSLILTMGQSPPGDTYNENGEGIPFYQGRTDFGFRFPTQRIFCSAPTRLAEAGDTLVSVRAPVGDVNVALQPCALGRGVASVRHPNGHQSFVLYSLRALKKHFELYDGEGTVFGSINKKDFQTLPIFLSSDSLLEEFEGIVAPLDAGIESNEKRQVLV